MSRILSVPCMLGLVLAGCASSRRARLDAHGIAIASDGGGAAVEAPAERAASAASASAVADYSLEQRLRRELRDRRAAGGKSALELIEPGSTLESRLRFALSRQQLGRDAEATTALAALTRDVPDCALAFVLLGQARLESGDVPAAVANLRRARALERELGRPLHPGLGYLLGRALLHTDEAEEGMRLLREELATGSNRAAAAELLAQVQGDAGDFEAAVASLDAVLDDVPDEPGLVLAKASLLGDCLRSDDALTLLESRGGRVAPPLLLFHRALLERQRGDRRKALGLLDEILDKHVGDAAVQASIAAIRSVREEVQSELDGAPRTHLRERELLGILRFSAQPAERARAARTLCANGRVELVPATVGWALRDEHEAVRIAALQVGAQRCANPADLLDTGLQDAAAGVRAAAAVVATHLPARQGLAPLVEAIGRETDPDAFLTLHRALLTISGQDLALPFGGERDAATRAKIAAAWRLEAERLGKDPGKDQGPTSGKARDGRQAKERRGS